jgi:hypothetical protein
VRTFSVTRREERKARECSLCLCRFLFRIFFLLLVGGVAFSPSAREARQTRAQKKGKREKRVFVWGSKKRDFSDDDDDEGVYIFLSEKKMAQRSPRKSLQLNRANTPINFSGPMQDVNVSSASFFF